VRGRPPSPAGSVSEDAALLAEYLGEEAAAAIDRFEQVQLAYVIRCCRRHPGLAAAGRELFAASRQRRRVTNDADRLRKYLLRHGVEPQRLWPRRPQAGAPE